MTMLVGQRVPESAPAASPARGGAGARASDNGFGDLLQSADRQPARSASRRMDEAETDQAVNRKDGHDSGGSEGRAIGNMAGLSRFDPFHLQADRKAASDDPSETTAKDKPGDDKAGDTHMSGQASLVSAIGHAMRDGPRLAQTGDRDADGHISGRAQTDRLDKTALSATSLDGETIATTDEQAQTTDAPPARRIEKSGTKAAGLSSSAAARDAPSLLSTLAVKTTGVRSSESQVPTAIETDPKAKPVSPDTADNSLQPPGGATKSSRASARVTGRLDHRDGDDKGGSNSDRFTGKDAAARQDNAVHVVSERSFPAPAAHSANPTVASLAEVLASTRGQATAGASAPHMQGATVAVSAHIMRIELHPAELGTVMASLKLAGDQLSVELKPETAEAYRHLSKESDAIAGSLKKLGLDVDTVTILQPSIAPTPTARADTGNQASAMPGRDGSQFQPGTSGGSGNGSGGQHSGGHRGHDGQTLDPAKPAHRERAGGSLFI